MSNLLPPPILFAPPPPLPERDGAAISIPTQHQDNEEEEKKEDEKLAPTNILTQNEPIISPSILPAPFIPIIKEKSTRNGKLTSSSSSSSTSESSEDEMEELPPLSFAGRLPNTPAEKEEFKRRQIKKYELNQIREEKLRQKLKRRAERKKRKEERKKERRRKKKERKKQLKKEKEEEEKEEEEERNKVVDRNNVDNSITLPPFIPPPPTTTTATTTTPTTSCTNINNITIESLPKPILNSNTEDDSINKPPPPISLPPALLKGDIGKIEHQTSSSSVILNDLPPPILLPPSHINNNDNDIGSGLLVPMLSLKDMSNLLEAASKGPISPPPPPIESSISGDIKGDTSSTRITLPELPPIIPGLPPPILGLYDDKLPSLGDKFKSTSMYVSSSTSSSGGGGVGVHNSLQMASDQFLHSQSSIVETKSPRRREVPASARQRRNKHGKKSSKHQSERKKKRDKRKKKKEIKKRDKIKQKSARNRLRAGTMKRSNRPSNIGSLNSIIIDTNDRKYKDDSDI